MNTDTIICPAPMEFDEYDLVDPVDILTPLEKSGFWDGVVCADLSAALIHCPSQHYSEILSSFE